MATLAIKNPLSQYFDLNGTPLDGGYIYVGVANQNPIAFPAEVWWDAGQSEPASQPIRTQNGYPVRDGTPALIFAEVNVSLLVQDKRGRQVFYARDSSEFDNSSILEGLFDEEFAELADTTNAANGSGKIGFNPTLLYAVNSIGARAANEIHVTDYPFLAVDNGSDQYSRITAALTALAARGGGKLVIPRTKRVGSTGEYGLSETLQVYDDITVEWRGAWLKVLDTTTYDAAIIPEPGAVNVTFENPMINGNNVPAACGIIIRRNNAECHIKGGLIKNCVHDASRKGGRGLNIEAGVDPAEYGPRNLTVYGLIVKDSYEALSVSGGSAPQQESNIRIDMMAENCQSAISLFGNSGTYPHSPDEMGCHITMTARNCGKATTYARAHGVINSDRGCNAKINIQVLNDTAYGAVGSLYRGDAYNIDLDAQFVGDCSSGLIDHSSYAESGAFPLSAYSSANSSFRVRHMGTVFETVSLPVISAGYLTKSQYDLVTGTVTSGKPGTVNLANKTDVYMKVYNTPQNALVEGFASDVGSNITFANVAAKKWDANPSALKCWATVNATTGAINRGFNCTVNRVSTGVYDVTFIVQPPGTTYVVLPDAQAIITSNQVTDFKDFTQAGFRITTYSADVVADRGILNFAVTW